MKSRYPDFHSSASRTTMLCFLPEEANNQSIYQSKKYLKFYSFLNIDSCSLMSSKERWFTSHSVNITSSFIVYTQGSLWLHPRIVTEALIKLGFYEARVLIIGERAGWMMPSICRVLQLEKSNLLSFKNQARGSDHKLAHFSQTKKKKRKKPASLQIITDWLRPICFLLLMLNVFTMLWNHSSSSLVTSYPQICTQRLVVPKKHLWMPQWFALFV